MKCPTCGTEGNEAYCLSCGQHSPGPANRDTLTNLGLANWGQRVGASLIDYLVLLAPLVIP